MRADDKCVERLREIYQDTYGGPISVEKARAMAHRLLTLYALLLRPLPPDVHSKLPH